MDWHETVAYHPRHEYKNLFHRAVSQRLDALAAALNWPSDSFDLRSNKAGIATSGEITLHHDTFYVQVSQAGTRGFEILLRTCRSRQDYLGGRNHFAPIEMLDDIPALAARVKAIIANYPIL